MNNINLILTTLIINKTFKKDSMLGKELQIQQFIIKIKIQPLF